MYMMAPLGEHYDDGFGAVADAFRNAAIKLREANGNKVFQWEHLPEAYLLRHAIELYLKSGIVIVHRRLRIPYDSESHMSAEPMLLTSFGKWEALYSTHDLVRLYWYWKKLITENKDRLASALEVPLEGGGDGMAVPEELGRWIGKLGSIDPHGDYLRYPMSKNAGADAKKSPFKDVTPDELFPPKRTEYVKALIVENARGQVMQTFMYGGTPNQDVAEAARQAVEMLNNYHAMMRFGLTGGW